MPNIFCSQKEIVLWNFSSRKCMVCYINWPMHAVSHILIYNHCWITCECFLTLIKVEVWAAVSYARYTMYDQTKKRFQISILSLRIRWNEMTKSILLHYFNYQTKFGSIYWLQILSFRFGVITGDQFHMNH